MINLFVIILVYAIYLLSVQEMSSSKETFLSQTEFLGGIT